MPPDDELYRCRACGWLLPDPPWGADGRTPLYEFCPCCGVEFGYQDATPAGARRYRQQWLAGGAGWHDPKRRPDGWSAEEQLTKVPAAFR